MIALVLGGYMPSRRQMLSGLGATVAVGLAGCTGSASGGSDTTDCRVRALQHGDGNVLDGGVMATVEDTDVRLSIPLSVDTVNSQNVDQLKIFAGDRELAHVIPVSPEDESLMANKAGVEDGQLRYEQYLGQRPFHGQYRIVAVDRTGTDLDSITIEFNCFPELNS